MQFLFLDDAHLGIVKRDPLGSSFNAHLGIESPTWASIKLEKQQRGQDFPKSAPFLMLKISLELSYALIHRVKW
jgi:hypothetical protein